MTIWHDVTKVICNKQQQQYWTSQPGNLFNFTRQLAGAATFIDRERRWRRRRSNVFDWAEKGQQMTAAPGPIGLNHGRCTLTTWLAPPRCPSSPTYKHSIISISCSVCEQADRRTAALRGFAYYGRHVQAAVANHPVGCKDNYTSQQGAEGRSSIADGG